MYAVGENLELVKKENRKWTYKRELLRRGETKCEGVKNMKIVSLEEKLNAQVKNIVAILGSEEPKEIKIMMYETQMEYFKYLLEGIHENLKEN